MRSKQSFKSKIISLLMITQSRNINNNSSLKKQQKIVFSYVLFLYSEADSEINNNFSKTVIGNCVQLYILWSILCIHSQNVVGCFFLECSTLLDLYRICQFPFLRRKQYGCWVFIQCSWLLVLCRMLTAGSLQNVQQLAVAISNRLLIVCTKQFGTL